MAAFDFRTTIEANLPVMYRMALAVCGNEADASDAMQDACLKLWSHRQSLEAAASPRAYCIGAVRNASLDIVSRRRHDITTLDAVADTVEDASRELERQETSAMVLKAISRLGESQRTVVCMRDIEGLSVAEIADKTGLNANNIRVLLSRGRGMLRKILLRL